MENLQPKLRFPEFKDVWGSSLLGKLIEIKGRIGYRGYTVNDIVSKDEGALAMSPSNISERGKLKFNNNTYISWFKYDESPEIQLENGYTLLVKTGSSYGKSALIENLNLKATINPQLVVLKPINIESKFLSIIISNNKVQKQIAQKIVGGTIPTLSQESISNFKISYPTLEEQTKIADFLGAVDKQLDILNQKKEKLNTYKKGVMQQLFSQQIRFKDDNGNDFPDWEEKTLGEVGVFYSGTGFNEKEQGGKVGIPFIKVSDMNLVGNEILIKSANNYVTNNQIDRNNYKIIKVPTILFAKVGAAIYLERKRIGENLIIDNNMMGFSPNGNIMYYYYMFQNIRLSKYAQNGALPSYNSKDIGKIQVNIPSIEEQTKIANFLSAIDNQIQAVENQITKTETYKKGLLQQMFV
ncbi:restriction endonuclease subunit S [Empedobacter falsenii]